MNGFKDALLNILFSVNCIYVFVIVYIVVFIKYFFVKNEMIIIAVPLIMTNNQNVNLKHYNQSECLNVECRVDVLYVCFSFFKDLLCSQGTYFNAV